jgi:hypothetical protein
MYFGSSCSYRRHRLLIGVLRDDTVRYCSALTPALNAALKRLANSIDDVVHSPLVPHQITHACGYSICCGGDIAVQCLEAYVGNATIAGGKYQYIILAPFSIALASNV